MRAKLKLKDLHSRKDYILRKNSRLEMKQNVQQKKCKCILGLKAHPSSVVNHECFLPGNLIYPSQIYLAPRILT